MRAPAPPVPHLLLLPRATSYCIVSLYTNGQPSGTSQAVGPVFYTLPSATTFISKFDLFINRTQHFVECLPHAKGHAVIDTPVRTIQVFLHRLFLFEWFIVAHILITWFIKQLRIYSWCHKRPQKDPGGGLFSYLWRNCCFLSESKATHEEQKRPWWPSNRAQLVSSPRLPTPDTVVPVEAHSWASSQAMRPPPA